MVQTIANFGHRASYLFINIKPACIVFCNETNSNYYFFLGYLLGFQNNLDSTISIQISTKGSMDLLQFSCFFQ